MSWGRKSEQSENQVSGGNIVGGDVNNNGQITHIAKVDVNNQPIRKISNLEKCYNDLKEKIKNSEDIEDYLSEINHYMQRYTNISQSDLRTLEQKLIDSHRQDYIDEALYYKEAASKFIMKYQQNTSIQYIVSNILALIKRNFMHFITPLIKADKEIYEVNSAIESHIIEPIEEILSNTDISIHFKQVNNLLYFLAGNCHICWDKQC